MAGNSIHKDTYKVYIIGSKGMINELLMYYLENLQDSPYKCTLVPNLATLSRIKFKGANNLVLCNCSDLAEHDQENACGRHISSAAAEDGVQWACFNVPRGLKLAERAINNGAKGLFFEDDTLKNFNKGIELVLNGELWFSREILQASLTNFVKNTKFKSSNSADNRGLTKREKEILKLMALGKSNDHIAKNLNISILTVKTHVSNIYKKINAPNRIQAIFWATKNFLQLKD